MRQNIESAIKSMVSEKRETISRSEMMQFVHYSIKAIETKFESWVMAIDSQVETIIRVKDEMGMQNEYFK